MIEINLLPERLRKRRRSSSVEILQLPTEMIIGLIGGLACLLVVVHLILLITTIGTKVKLSASLKQWQQLSPARQKVDGVKKEINSIQEKMKYIVSLKVDKKISWAKKLNLISDNIVRGAWLTKVYFAEGILKIEGSAVSKKGEEMINVGRFAANLKEDKSFFSDLKNLELTLIQRRNIKTIEVVDFVITVGVKE